MEAVRPADDQHQGAGGKPPTLQLPGKISAAPPCPVARERYQGGVVRYPGAESAGLLSQLSGYCRRPARLADFLLVEFGISLKPSGIVVHRPTVVRP